MKLILTLISSMLLSTNVVAKNVIADFGPEFFFGLATAPGHAEDDLNDGWQRFADEGKVAAYDNANNPEKRLWFWSEPEVELDWAKKTGVDVYRLGVDWGRLAPEEPSQLSCEGKKQVCASGVQDSEALKRYREILLKVKARKMKVMLTLFHHSLPVWAIDKGGWANREVREHFVQFSKDIVMELGDLVDQWVIFNEPALYNSLSYVVGMWPHSEKGLNVLDQRIFGKALVNMVEAHKRVYDYIHKIDKHAFVGIAKNMALYKGHHIHDKVISNFLKYRMNWEFLDRTINYMDFIGINYYGEETVKNFSIFFDDKKEYSEAGQGVNPKGLYDILTSIHESTI